MAELLGSSSDRRDSNSAPVIIGITLVVAAVAITAFFLRPNPKPPAAPQPYVANIKLSDFKMGEAENFVGAKLTYVNGRVDNTGDKTAVNILLHVIFRDSMAQVAQAEDVPLYVLDTSGPYPDAVKLANSPLAPGQTKEFRLTFEHVSEEWNRDYPEIRVTGVTLK